MRLRSHVPSGGLWTANLPELSRSARLRLKWFDFHEAHERNARLTCRHFGISPQTFYRWKGRFEKHRAESLENHSCRPRRTRHPEYSSELVIAVQKLRETYPRWGKDKLAVLLKREGISTSVSTVGRILKRLKESGVIKEPIRNAVSAHRRVVRRPYAIRKPKDYVIKTPGDLVQLDTLDLRPLPGVIRKQFTARDMYSRWDVVGVYSQATAHTACRFLDDLEERSPYKIRGIQIDGGSEFQAGFEIECQRRAIRLFVLPPRSPKLNGCVERANRTHTEEFYELTDSSFELIELRQDLLQWEHTYNTIRPHQAIGYLTPLEFITQCNQTNGKEVRCH
jgi:putative transposase